MWLPRYRSLLVACVAISQYFSRAQGATYTNPLKESNGSDPFLVYTGGYYYMTTTTWEDIQITRDNTGGPQDSWYLYYTAGNSDNLDGQRSHVLQGGATPWDEYTYASQLASEWSIDGSVLRVSGQNYFMWSCLTGGGQSLCIATLDTPVTIGERHTLSEPTEDWEQSGTPVEEGPEAMYHDGTTYVVYSGSYCWTPDYQLGYLTWDGSGDPLDRGSWSKTGPVFSSANGNYGTGHNALFLSPDETEIWNIYHATSNPEGACDGTRYTMAQIVNWNSDGTPDFGEAPPLSEVLDGPSGE